MKSKILFLILYKNSNLYLKKEVYVALDYLKCSHLKIKHLKLVLNFVLFLNKDFNWKFLDFLNAKAKHQLRAFYVDFRMTLLV